MKLARPLYIIMRNDTESLTPGKACAQAAHAANDFMYVMSNSKMDSVINIAYNDWLEEAGTFGTTIVLGATGDQINELNSLHLDFVIGIDLNPAVMFNKIIDETYPISDGAITHKVPFMTCAWVFAPEKLFFKSDAPYEYNQFVKIFNKLELY